jgi:hypothetical protein
MNWVAPWLLAVGFCAGTAERLENSEWPKVERPCGVLLHSHEVPIKHQPNEFNTKSVPIRRAVVRLYKREGKSQCCEGLAPVAEVVTGRLGSFRFRSVEPAPYWVVAEVDGHEFKIAIEYNRVSNSDAKCSDFLYEIMDNGQFNLGRMITVD